MLSDDGPDTEIKETELHPNQTRGNRRLWVMYMSAVAIINKRSEIRDRKVIGKSQMIAGLWRVQG